MDFEACPHCGKLVPAKVDLCLRCCRPLDPATNRQQARVVPPRPPLAPQPREKVHGGWGLVNLAFWLFVFWVILVVRNDANLVVEFSRICLLVSSLALGFTGLWRLARRWYYTTGRDVVLRERSH